MPTPARLLRVAPSLLAASLALACEDGWDVSVAPTAAPAPRLDRPRWTGDPLSRPAAIVCPPGPPPLARGAICGVAGAPPCASFTDETVAAGLEGPVPGTAAGDVVAWADLDGDGWLDVARTAYDGLRVWRNLGNATFEAAAAPLGLDTAPADSVILPADVNGDGRVDLVLLGLGTGGVWRASPGGPFVELAGALPPDILATATAGALADWDGDGDLDLHVGHDPTRTVPGWLLRNDGTGLFTHAGPAAGLEGPGSIVLQSLWLDADGDGDPDLVLANDRGAVLGVPTQLFRNDDGFLVDVTPGSGLDALLLDGMGLAQGDFDEDGDPDLWVANTGNVPLAGMGNVLFRNDGDDLFADVSAPWNATVITIGWATAFLDFDGDGDLDLLGVGDSSITGDAGTRLLENLGPDGFRDVTEAAGLAGEAGTAGYGASVGDYDADAFPDIVIAHTSYGPPLTLYRNGGSAARWLHVRLHGAGANTFAIGAQVTVWVNGRRLVRSTDAGSGFGGANPPDLIFGLGEATVVDRLEVRWPSGTLTAHACVAVNGTVDLWEM